MNSPTTIGVIGGGSVAVSFVHHLVESLAQADGALPRGLRVLVFEPREKVGRGSAYEVDLETNLLNVVVSGMSAAGDDKDHFKRWLTDRGVTSFGDRQIRGDSFVSRPLFGAYLESVFESAVQRARCLGVAVEHVRTAVESLGPASPESLEAKAPTGLAYRLQRAVLSIGNLDSDQFREFRELPNYAASPYPTLDLSRRINPLASVCVIGTSLSAVDAIVALAAGGHKGRIVAVSRTGRLPTVRSLHNRAASLRPEFKCELQRRESAGKAVSLESLVKMVKAEFDATVDPHHGEDLLALWTRAPDAKNFLDEEIRLSATRARPWQAFGGALNEAIDVLWNLLSPQDRMRFNRDIKPAWMSRRVTFPMENALAMRELFRAGQLRVLGGFRSAQFDHGRGEFNIHISPPGTPDRSSAVEILHVDHLVNATSFSCDAERSDMPLLRDLLATGLASPDPFGGLRVDFDSGLIVSPDGTLNGRVSALGSMASGTYFWTNAMEVNARLAMGQAQRMVQALRKATPDAGQPG